MAASPIQELKRVASLKLSHARPNPTVTRTEDAPTFLNRAGQSFSHDLDPETLASKASLLTAELKNGIQHGTISMLPSCTSTLPTGEETGAYLALDVGGSTFRIALVELNQRSSGSDVAIRSTREKRFEIEDYERSLQGEAFFDWMAERIGDVFGDDMSWVRGERGLATGLAWSFPIEQWSVRDGALMQMGKGFQATQGLIGRNLADLLSDACKRKNLNVTVHAIVNDSSASLLSSTYLNTSSPIALILGTGINAALRLPVACIPRSRFGPNRPSSWFENSTHVIVNTELSMFGKPLWNVTKWDAELNSRHPHPDFQPLEHLTSGRYLGEIVRIVLMDMISRTGLFGGVVPSNFEPYDFTSSTITAVERDDSGNLSLAYAVLVANHRLPGHKAYTYADIKTVKDVCVLVSTRAAAYTAVALAALIGLYEDVERVGDIKSNGDEPGVHVATGTSSTTSTSSTPTNGTSHSAPIIRLGCSGGVIEKYPRMMSRTQMYLEEIMKQKGSEGGMRIELVPNPESALKGAAVAVACAAGDAS